MFFGDLAFADGDEIADGCDVEFEDFFAECWSVGTLVTGEECSEEVGEDCALGIGFESGEEGSASSADFQCDGCLAFGCGWRHGISVIRICMLKCLARSSAVCDGSAEFISSPWYQNAFGVAGRRCEEECAAGIEADESAACFGLEPVAQGWIVVGVAVGWIAPDDGDREFGCCACCVVDHGDEVGHDVDDVV